MGTSVIRHKMNGDLSIDVSFVNKRATMLIGEINFITDIELNHRGVYALVDGCVHFNKNGNVVNLDYKLESYTRSIRIFSQRFDFLGAGIIPAGKTCFPIEMQLCPQKEYWIESYHGVYISVVYSVAIICDLGMLNGSTTCGTEFYLEFPQRNKNALIPDAMPLKYFLTHEHVRNDAAEPFGVAKFNISGIINRTVCFMDEMFAGELVVNYSNTPIKSIELQLARMESITDSEGKTTREMTEIQNIQVVDGDIARGVSVPLNMSFPRLFSCPTVIASCFSIEFEVNLVVVFSNGYSLIENFPIVLLR